MPDIASLMTSNDGFLSGQWKPWAIQGTRDAKVRRNDNKIGLKVSELNFEDLRWPLIADR